VGVRGSSRRIGGPPRLASAAGIARDDAELLEPLFERKRRFAPLGAPASSPSLASCMLAHRRRRCRRSFGGRRCDCRWRVSASRRSGYSGHLGRGFAGRHERARQHGRRRFRGGRPPVLGGPGGRLLGAIRRQRQSAALGRRLVRGRNRLGCLGRRLRVRADRPCRRRVARQFGADHLRLGGRAGRPRRAFIRSGQHRVKRRAERERRKQQRAGADANLRPIVQPGNTRPHGSNDRSHHGRQPRVISTTQHRVSPCGRLVKRSREGVVHRCRCRRKRAV
jgi:hypothetical protein